MDTYKPLDEKTVWLYVLVDPETGRCRYVGVSVNPKRRYRQHLTILTRRYCSCWIQGLAAKGLKPRMEVLEELAPGSDWGARERFWIDHYRRLGDPLTNLVEGGKGVFNPCEVTREKMRQAAMRAQNGFKPGHPCYLKEHTPETRAKISAAMQGNQRGANVRHTEEEKQRISDRMKGKQHFLGKKRTPDARMATSEKMRGNQNSLGHRHSEEARKKMSEKSRAYWQRRKQELIT